MQYGLFLKGIGLSLEQALQFWRSEFVKGKVDADKVTLHLQLVLPHIVLVFHSFLSPDGYFSIFLCLYFCVCSFDVLILFADVIFFLHPSITLKRVTQMNERRY